MKKIFIIALIGFSQCLLAQDAVQPGNSAAATDLEKIHSISGLETVPQFPGGMQKFYRFVATNFIVPEHPELVSGKVFASFVIEKDGSVTDIKILRDLGFGTGEEIVRVLRKSPKWTPGQQNGKVVRVMYSLPISISVPEADPVFNEADVKDKPQFPGGEKALEKYFADNFKGKGAFTVSFIIEIDGKPYFIKCNENVSETDCAQIKSILKAAPDWKPGKEGNFSARVQLTRTFTTK